VADVFGLYGEAFRHAHRLSSSHVKVMRAIQACRTAALGGHIERCDQCGFTRQAYNSCRNRHCPKCQALAKARWLAARQAELLPVNYFHTVFTLPHELNALALANKKIVFDILFRSVSETLLRFAAKELGGKLGVTAILHTWDQKLNEHIHLHCAIPAGALSFDGKSWNPSHPAFLFPVKALGRMFRGKFLDFLKSAHTKNRLRVADDRAFQTLLRSLYDTDWVVYSKEAFAGPKAVLDYFGRYTHRIAISNHRILDVSNNQVTFTYRDRKDDNKQKVMTLPADEFIRRFLLHTVPASFMRIRHFGFLANRSKKKDLARCRELLSAPAPASDEPPKTSTQELLRDLTGKDLAACPACQTGRLLITAEILARPLPLWNSS
jgi:hypothetical protein